MTFSTRMWLSGALLPLIVLAVALLTADRLFHLALDRSLDRALLAQAAVESASLFDGPDQAPHLHMATSPLVESVRPFAPEGVLFGPDGRVVTGYPPRASHASERVLPTKLSKDARLATLEHNGVRERRLMITVRSPSGALYTLRLTASTAQLDAAAATFHSLSLLALALSAIVLLIVQTLEGRSLGRRLARLSEHVDALRKGDLDRKLPRDAGRDELAALSDVLAQATAALKSARDARDRLVADAAHELRTPLTLMRTSLDLALRKERSVEELKTALRESREEVDRLAALSSRLLDVASLAQSEESVETCDLALVAHAAIEAASGEAHERGLSLTASGQSALFVPARPVALRRALDNLLANALKYARKSIDVVIEEDALLVRITVRDDGPGIEAEERELVFEPFHRARGAAPGAGLGLTIVREVAKAHGGKAYVGTAPSGAAVVIELPRHQLA